MRVLRFCNKFVAKKQGFMGSEHILTTQVLTEDPMRCLFLYDKVYCLWCSESFVQ